MKRRRKIIEPEPSYLLELVRLSVPRLIPIHKHLEVECDPVRSLSVEFPMYVSVAEKFVVEYIGAILFLNSLFNTSVTVLRTRSILPRSPTSRARRDSSASFMSSTFLSVMTEVHDGVSDEINTFLHKNILPHYPGSYQ